MQSRFDLEMEEYMEMGINGNGFHLLFWDDASRSFCDSSNKVYELAKRAILGMFATVYHKCRQYKWPMREGFLFSDVHLE